MFKETHKLDKPSQIDQNRTFGTDSIGENVTSSLIASFSTSAVFVINSVTVLITVGEQINMTNLLRSSVRRAMQVSEQRREEK